jgi:type II secretory pathway component PulL
MPGIIPRSTSRTPGWVNVLLWTSLIILVITLVGYFGIKRGISSLEDEIEETQQKIINIETPENRKIEKDLLIYQAQANYFTQALTERRHPTEAFILLKKLAHPDVVFTSFDFNQAKYQISLQGYASNFQVVGEQLSVMREDESVQEAEMTSLAIGEKGEINLGITLKLLPSLFK